LKKGGASAPALFICLAQVGARNAALVGAGDLLSNASWLRRKVDRKTLSSLGDSFNLSVSDAVYK
jgi:hypothetical protein